MPSRALSLAALTSLMLSPAALAGETIQVTIRGEVEFNSISPPPLGNAMVGDDAAITFTLDSDDFVNNATFPTRGYVIDESSFELTIDTTTVGIASPFPAGPPPFFVLRDNDPAVDGFFLSTDTSGPTGVPLDQAGVFGDFIAQFSVTYGGATLPSLDILDAVGTYDFTGLTVFSFSVDDGPFNPLGFIFEDLEIAVVEQTWNDEGCALAGATGEPSLLGLGDLSAGSNNALRLLDAAPSATAGLFFGLGSGAVPFKGGTLKPFPFFPPTILTTSATGAIQLPFVMPAGAPAGTELWFQYAISDMGAPVNVALSNALRGVTP